MEKLTVDFNNLETLEEFHDFIKKNLNLSSEYGRNLEALNSVVFKSDVKFEVIKGGPILMEMQEIIADILCHDIKN
ncbi:MAG: barstar family protein [Peptostreptococcus sp.]|uniref:barstar family protein n=1 Tax=Peptostreptococcus sp. TaxID=1262 RepID=UPI002FC9A2D9